jgi:hypothetical protein
LATLNSLEILELAARPQRQAAHQIALQPGEDDSQLSCRGKGRRHYVSGDGLQLAIVRAFGHPNATAALIAASLAQIGEFSFILAALGVEYGLLPQEAAISSSPAPSSQSCSTPPFFFLAEHFFPLAQASPPAEAAKSERLRTTSLSITSSWLALAGWDGSSATGFANWACRSW